MQRQPTKYFDGLVDGFISEDATKRHPPKVEVKNYHLDADLAQKYPFFREYVRIEELTA